jgi:hypothetical protein
MRGEFLFSSGICNILVKGVKEKIDLGQWPLKDRENERVSKGARESGYPFT